MKCRLSQTAQSSDKTQDPPWQSKERDYYGVLLFFLGGGVGGWMPKFYCEFSKGRYSWEQKGE